MSFINKNANLFLLFLIILSATALVGATVFFQMNFDRINSEYQQKLNQLNSVSQELQADQAALDKIKADLSLKSQSEEQLGQKYTDVSSQKDQLQTAKTQLENEKGQLTDELTSTEGELQSTKSSLEASKNQVDLLTGQNSNLQSQLTVSESERKTAQDDAAACQTAKSKCTCP